MRLALPCSPPVGSDPSTRLTIDRRADAASMSSTFCSGEKAPRLSFSICFIKARMSERHDLDAMKTIFRWATSDFCVGSNWACRAPRQVRCWWRRSLLAMYALNIGSSMTTIDEGAVGDGTRERLSQNCCVEVNMLSRCAFQNYKITRHATTDWEGAKE